MFSLCFSLFSCRKTSDTKKEEGYPLSHYPGARLLGGSSSEASENFFMNDEELFCLSDTKRPYSGVIKVRARNGTVAAIRSYVQGLPDGDFHEWHENGSLKTKTVQGRFVNMNFFIWTTKGEIYSRRYFKRWTRRLWPI